MASSVQVFRSFGTGKLLLDSLKEPLTAGYSHAEHEGSVALWKKLFFFVCCPSVAVAYGNILLSEEHPPPEFKKYPHLRIRNKAFPWRDGVKTLFHNPHTNALPDGYEDVGGHH